MQKKKYFIQFHGHIVRIILHVSIIRQYSYSRYGTGTSLQSRLMLGNIIKNICMWGKDFPRMSLDCKLVPVQYREYEYCLILTLGVKGLKGLFFKSSHVKTSWAKGLAASYMSPTGDSLKGTLISIVTGFRTILQKRIGDTVISLSLKCQKCCVVLYSTGFRSMKWLRISLLDWIENIMLSRTIFYDTNSPLSIPVVIRGDGTPRIVYVIR